MNLFHRSRAFVEKHLPSLKLWRGEHKRHHHLIIALLVVLVAGAGGVSLYKKIAKAATFTFTQSVANGGWATLDTSDVTGVATHAAGNGSSWSKYASSTNVTASADDVRLPSISYAFTDDGATSTVPTASTSGGTFGAGAHSSTVATTTASGASVGLGFGVDGGTGADGAIDLSQTGNGGCLLDGSGNTRSGVSSYLGLFTAPIPATVSYGGSLVYPGSGDYIYALRGNSSAFFYAYSLTNSNWTTFDPTDAPATIAGGGSLVYPGSGDYIYALRGGGYTTFYAYSLTNNNWTTFDPTDTPLAIGTGDSMVYPGSGDYIYALRGGSTTFYAYSLTNNNWTTFDPTDTPLAISSGGSLVYPGSGDYIYALRGGSTTFYAYSLTNNNWTTFDPTDAPFLFGNGASLVYPGSGDYIYALRGGLVTTFYRYKFKGSGPNHWDVPASELGGTCTLNTSTSFNFTTVNIPSETTLKATGANPLLLNATGNVTIVGTISLNGESNTSESVGGVGGSGGYSGGNSGANGSGLGFGNGCTGNCYGGGAGHGATGAAGTSGIVGMTYTDITGGSGGGGGGGQDGSYGGGSGGGGYLKIVSSGNITNSGTISANGGGVVPPASGYSGGGGSGGRINLIAGVDITNSGIIRANGGASSNGGGGGGGGRIILQDSDGSITGGTITATGGATGGGTPSPVYTQSPLTHVASGTFTSADIDLGAFADFTGKTLVWTETLNGGDIQIQMRSASTQGALSSATWYGPTGTGDWYTASGGNINTVHNGARWIQYKANLTTPSPYNTTPTLDSVIINYTQYGSGDLTSSKYDIGSEAVISKLTWVASTSTTETVKFQIRSSADGSTWSYWCGDSTCDASETDYFEDANNGVTITTGHPLRSGTGADADRYFQYKVFLGSGGSATPTLTSVTVQYVVNAPPEVQNVTAVQNADGTVTVHFDMRDTDTNDVGAATPGKVISTLQYNNAACGAGPSWADATAPAVTGDAGANTTITSSYPTVASSTITWNPTTDNWTGKYCATQQVRIKLNDSEGANNLGYSSAGSFLIDTTAPVVASTGGFLVDSSVGATGLAGIKLAATDDSTVQYRLCNDSAFPSSDAQGNSCAWSNLAASPIALATSTTSWNTVLDANLSEVVYMQVRDAYGNVTARTATAPAVPANFLTTDTTNPTDGTYREFLSWGVATSTGFGSYQVWHRVDGEANYSPLGTPITPNTLNYYTHTILTATSSAHNYKVVTISANGDISEFTAPTSDTPDGSGSADITPPYIASIATSSVGNTSANITFSTYSDSTLTPGELATSTVRYASYTGSAPTTCPTASSVSTGTYVVNHSVYLTGLDPSTNYVFCVLAKNIANYTSTPSSVSSAGGTFTTVGGPRITGVTEREVTDISATIFWNTDTSSDSKVYYATTVAGVNGSTPVTGATVTTAGTNANGTFYQHQIGLGATTPLVSGRTYYYKVVSADTSVPPNTSTDDNTGQYYSFVTLTDTTPPTITGTSTPVLAPTAAVIVWQTDELATSKVDYGTESGVYSKGVAEDSSLSIYHVSTISSATNNALGSGDNLLVKETPYYYRVTSKDAANNTATATGTFTTPADGNVTITMVNVVNSAGDAIKDTTAPTISGVAVSDITPFSAVVKFDTSEAAVSFVDYGKDASYGDSAGDKVYGTTHTVKLRGLSLGTEYHIKVTAHDKAGNTGTGSDQTFKTTFLSENLKDMAKIENIEQFQKEIEDTIESILPSLVPPFVSKPVVTDITENGATVSFRTNIKSFPVVGFVEDAFYDTTKENPYTGEVSDMTEKSLDHTVALIGLKQNTKYRAQARAFSLPKVIGKSADISFTTKAAKISGSIIERKKDSFTVVWTTDEPTSSVVEYKNTASGVTERKTDDAMRTSHSMRVENLPSGTTYAVDISGLNEQGNVVEAGASLTVTTSRDVTPPVISGFKVDNALVPGRTDRIQTIVSWKTDEPANSTTYYEEGAGTAGDTKELINKNEVLDSYVTAHSVILPNLKPGTIYRLKVTSSDDSGNEASFGPRTVITPRQTESITDIIFKNFEDSFKFLRDI